jgi:hypothetical protein
MFGREAIVELQLRKRTLVIESELNRLALQTEWQHVRAATDWVSQAGQWVRRANPWLAVLAPLLGVLTARTLPREGGIVGRALGLLKWVRPLLALWQSFVGTPPPEVATKPPGS